MSGRRMGRCRWLPGFVTIVGCRTATPTRWSIVAGSSTNSPLSPQPGVRGCSPPVRLSALKASCPTAVEPIMHAQQGDLVGIVAGLSVADTEQAASVWRQRAEASGRVT